ncbi:hypothetical protein ACYIU4_002833 [Clostridium botulinum]
MSKQSTTTIFCSQKNILANGQHFVSVLIKIDASKVVANEQGKKIVPVGSIISKDGVVVNDGTAYGVTINEIDVTNGSEGVGTVIHGFIDLETLPVKPSEETIKVLKQITFM